MFALLYFGWKFWHKTKIVRPEDMDIWTGRREDIKEPFDGSKKSVLYRIKNVLVG